MMLPTLGEPGLLALTVCQVCGWASLEGYDLCVGCLDIREWSRVNRAFCDFFHRGQPAARAPGAEGDRIPVESAMG